MGEPFHENLNAVLYYIQIVLRFTSFRRLISYFLKKMRIVRTMHSYYFRVVYMRLEISLRWDVSPKWDTFHPAFPWEKYSTWMRYFSSELVCMPIFKKLYITFMAYWVCCFHFDFELIINIQTAKFYKKNCTFALFRAVILKTHRV